MQPGHDEAAAAAAGRTTPPPSTVAASDGARAIRVLSLYGTSWRFDRRTGRTRELTDCLRLGRLDRFFRANADHLPAMISRRPIRADAISCDQWRTGTITGAELWLLSMPTDGVVVALHLDLDCWLIDTIELLTSCYEVGLHIEGTDLESVARTEAVRHDVVVGDGTVGLAPERHQIVCATGQHLIDPANTLRRVIYRSHRPPRPEHSVISYPSELNRRSGTAAVGRDMSVLCDQDDYLEDAAFASATQAVASARWLREIQDDLHRALRDLPQAETAGEQPRTRRDALAEIADTLTRREHDLSAAMAPAELGALIPSQRGGEYHQTVWEAIGLAQRAATISQLHRRMAATTHAELTAIGGLEQHADDRRRRWTTAAGIGAAVAIPISLPIAFLATRVGAWVYAVAGLLAVAAFLIARYAHGGAAAWGVRWRPGWWSLSRAIARPPRPGSIRER
jgi:hypothetical protein